MRQLGAPVGRYPWLEQIPDLEYPLIDRQGERLPDLQSRSRGEKRLKGQYFTPETLVEILYSQTGILERGGSLLDPACGDGGFLVPAAHRLAQTRSGPFLDEVQGFDLDPQALLICLSRLLTAAWGKGWPRLQCRDFLLDPPEERFDAVAGNPPYRVNLPEDLRRKLQEQYATAEGEKDLYTFFLEGAMRALKDGGEALMLTSHTWLVNHQCSRLREFLFAGQAVKNLFLLPYNFFLLARGVLPAVIHVARRSPAGAVMRVHDRFDAGGGHWQLSREAAPQSFLHPTGLREALRDPRLQALFERMARASRPLGEIARIGVGIQESTVRGAKISPWVREKKVDACDVPVLRGKEIQPFRVHWEGKFLHYGPHLTYAGDPTIFRGPKILYQNIRNESLERRLVATLDREHFFPKNSLSWICAPKAPFTLEYLLGLLNSPLLNAWFREHFFSFHITVTQMRQIPIAVGTPQSRHQVEHLVEKLLTENPDTSPSCNRLNELSECVLRSYFPAGDAEEIKKLL